MLDLDELDQVFANRWFWSSRGINFAWFRKKDHLRSLRNDNDGESMKSLLRRFLSSKNIVCDGPIRLLTQLRYLGFVMNPVSFFYCYESDNETVSAIVAQVNNTPWGEEHLYLIQSSGSKRSKTISIDQLTKEFHVSPFMPMDMEYSMKFTPPAEKLAVCMTNYKQNQKALDVVMNLERKKIKTMNLISVLLSYPLISFKVFSAIYWEALKIHWKKIPFHSHPRKSKGQAIEGTSSAET